jgi:predicted Zn-dependent peptidase
MAASGQEVVRVDFVFSVGQWHQAQKLQALFTCRMLREGCRGYTSSSFAERLDYYGAWLELSVAMNRTFVTLYTLKKFFPQTIEMVQQMLFEPTFSEEQFSTIRANNKAQFMVNMQKGDVLAMRALRRSVYGEAHPCGMSAMAEDYDALRTEVLADFYGRYYGSRNCTVYLSGSIDENVTSRIESCFGGAEWGGCLEVGQRDYSLSPAIDKKNFIAHPGAVQCSIRMGSLLMDVKDEDYLPMRVLNTVLGGYFGSRLMKNVREDKGYTYHISSDLVTNTSQVMFMISCEALADKAEEVMAEVKGEMERLRTQLVSDAELHMVRSYMMGEICRNYEGAFSLTDAYIFMDHLGLPQSHIEDTVAAVRATDAARLLQLARRYFDFETLHTVVVHP